MNEPQAFLNGRFLPASQANISLFDAGFAMGATVTEQMRTFGGKLFQTQRHLARLYHSLELVGLDAGFSEAEMIAIAEQLVTHNHPQLDEGDDLGLVVFVTPGPQRSLSGGFSGGTTVGLHTFPLAFDLWAEKYHTGQSLVVTRVRQVPAECWPPEIKCRSRMHYFLADREAGTTEPGARALLTDLDGFVTETPTANILIYRADEGLLTPPRAKTLGGISLRVAAKLAHNLGITLTERDLRPEDVARADEVLLTSTPLCVLPVVRLNSKPIGSGQPGPLFQRLVQAWGELVGLDITAQAAKFARRPARS